MRDRVVRAAVALSGWLAAGIACADTPPMQPDIPPSFTAPSGTWDYVRREVMIPMRDGVKLYTVIVIPQGRPARADHPDAHAVQRRRAAPSAS